MTGDGFTGDGSSRGQAGAVAAAARELRPVEIVGLYEEQKDSMEVGLGLPAWRCCQEIPAAYAIHFAAC